jgi:hypothetical protein
MAWLIGQAVIRGEIDNTVEGLTRGRVWLAGRDEPLSLHLLGDCWRDLAGMRMEFENPNPEPDIEALASLAARQHGPVGDLTASRRSRGWSESGLRARIAHADEIPDAWRNCLYIEWFSETNGRVVIESDQFEIRLGNAIWRMDADAEQAQKLANLQAMRDYLSGVIRRPGPANTPTAGGDADEREWEKLLKQSDRLDTAYREAIEKYRDDPDSDQKEAFVMGWDSLLGAMAEQKSCPDRNDDAWQDDESPGFPDDPDTREAPGDGDDDDASSFESLPTAETEDPHPLRELAGELAMRAYDLVANQEPKSESGHRLVSNMMQVSGKLAGALMATGSDYRPETGFVLAILKRCLQFINDAMSGCQELILAEEDPDHKHALEALLQDIFEIRGQIVELRRELREN